MKNYVLFLSLLVVSFISCEKPSYRYSDYENTFSFQQKEQTVEVTTQMESFYIHGKIDRFYDPTNKAFLRVIPELSSAEEGVHYEVPKDLTMYFGGDTVTSKMAIQITPQNIKEQVTLLFTTRGKTAGKDYSRYIDTLTVYLRPNLIEQ